MDKLKPSKNLRQSIIFGIRREEYRQAKIYLLASLFTFVASLAGAVWSMKYLMESFYESGFYQYLSLLFSGNSMILKYLKELLFSLVETLPIIAVSVFLITSGFLIWSAINIIVNTRRFVLRVN